MIPALLLGDCLPRADLSKSTLIVNTRLAIPPLSMCNFFLPPTPFYQHPPQALCKVLGYAGEQDRPDPSPCGVQRLTFSVQILFKNFFVIFRIKIKPHGSFWPVRISKYAWQRMQALRLTPTLSLWGEMETVMSVTLAVMSNSSVQRVGTQKLSFDSWYWLTGVI